MPAARPRAGGPGKAAGRSRPGEDPWQTVSASAMPFADGWHTPHALDDAEIEALIEKLRRRGASGRSAPASTSSSCTAPTATCSTSSSRRSPTSATDAWGGSLENRLRLPLEIIAAVRAAVPEMMLGARLSVTEWVEGGLSVEDGVAIAAAYREPGVAYVCGSSGGNSPHQKVPTGPGYQVHLAEAVRRGTGVATRAVGHDRRPAPGRRDRPRGRADMVALGRAFLADPRWAWRAAAALGHEFGPPPQYARAAALPKKWAGGLRAARGTRPFRAGASGGRIQASGSTAQPAAAAPPAARSR